MFDHVGGEVVVFLVLAHLVGDFILQSDAQVKAKREGRLGAHLGHAALHAALSYACAGIWTLWLLPLTIGLTHGAIDWLKEAVTRQNRAWIRSRHGRAAIFTIDQLMHIGVIFFAAMLLIDANALPAWIDWFGPQATAAVIVFIGLIATTWIGAVVVGFATDPYLELLQSARPRGSSQGAESAGITDAPSQTPNNAAAAPADSPVRRGFPKGGRTIGQLERALVFLFVMTGNMTGVGFLVAAKSVFRFGEITNPTQRKEAEYILIGTLMSFTWAIFAAWLTRFIVGGLIA